MIQISESHLQSKRENLKAVNEEYPFEESNISNQNRLFDSLNETREYHESSTSNTLQTRKIRTLHISVMIHILDRGGG